MKPFADRVNAWAYTKKCASDWHNNIRAECSTWLRHVCTVHPNQMHIAHIQHIQSPQNSAQIIIIYILLWTFVRRNVLSGLFAKRMSEYVQLRYFWHCLDLDSTIACLPARLLVIVLSSFRELCRSVFEFLFRLISDVCVCVNVFACMTFSTLYLFFIIEYLMGRLKQKSEFYI